MKSMCALLAGIAALVLAGTASAQEVTLKLHHAMPAQAAIHAGALVPWAEKLAADSGGRIKVELYPSMQLGGSAADLYDQMRSGVVDLAWAPVTGDRFPIAGVFELPFMPTSAEATSKALQDYCQHNCAGEFEGVKVIAWHTSGPVLIHSKNPVTRLEDINGLKIGEAPAAVDRMLAALGARLVAMPAPAAPESMAKGLIDAAVMPWDVTPLLRIVDLVNNHTGFSGTHGLYAQPFVLGMNQASYDRLPGDLKRVIDANSGLDIAATIGRALDAADLAAREEVRKLTNAVVPLDETETQRWKDAAAPLVAQWETDMSARGLDGAALLREARALVERYSAPPSLPEESEETTE